MTTFASSAIIASVEGATVFLRFWVSFRGCDRNRFAVSWHYLSTPKKTEGIRATTAAAVG